MGSDWQNVAVVVIIGLAGLWLGRTLWRSLRAFQQSGKDGGCPPGCSCGANEKKGLR